MKHSKFLLLCLAMCMVFMLDAQDTKRKNKNVQFQVKAACGMCSSRIETIAWQTEGVRKVLYDLNEQTLSVKVDWKKFDEDILHQSLADAGHSTDKIEADKNAYAALPACCQYDGVAQTIAEDLKFSDAPQGETKDNVVQLHVQGACEMCTERIESFAIVSTGVISADYDLASQTLTVEVFKGTFNEDELHQILAAGGHGTNKVKADPEAYNDLPACCQYDGEPKQINHDFQFSDVATPHNSNASPNITGMIYERDAAGNRIPLIGATVTWVGQQGGTTTDVDGHFSLGRVADTEDIEVSYVGYQNDTISMAGQNMVSIVMLDALTLDAVEVVHRKRSTEISYLNPIKVQEIGEKEFLKAACCNIAESFETNPSVDVSFTDAVTGTRKIQLLGLEGPNIQVTRENIPYIRGLSSLYGFQFTPGTWLEGIQLNLGTGSVANGFESLAGQINIELKKPCSNMEKLYLNLYASEGGRVEFNANIRHDINEKWYAATLLHGKRNFVENDRNGDNFLDNPLSQNLIALHRWKFIGDDGFRWQAGIKGTKFENTGGQLGASTTLDPEADNLWTSNLDIKRIEGWMKFGKVFLDNPLASIGLQLSGSHHDQDALFGTRVYDAKQTSFYANFIYQNVLKSIKHKYRIGYSFQYDDFDETVLVTPFARKEVSTGIFAEYTYQPSEVFTAVLGARQDHHNNYGIFFTPRANLRYAPNDETVFRLAAGRSLRTANVFAENIGLFASNRRIILSPEAPADFPYGLSPEIGWNFGANVSKSVQLSGKEFVLGLDYYYTYFQDQVVVDFDRRPQEVNIFNLDGPSFSHSVQAQVDTELFPFFDVRVAYRYNDVKTRFLDGVLRKPLISAHRAFINLAYEIENKWTFDATLNWQGSKRIPDTSDNPAEFRLPSNSPNFFMLNGQITKKWKQFEWYVGVENALNFRQDNPIISAENPNSDFFDSSLVWGPVFGRNVYTGFRYKIF